MSNTTTDIDVRVIDLDLIDPDPGNRRTVLDADFIKSIKTHGVIQAITVRPHEDNPDRYRLVAGHRRHAAATKVGRTTIPALIRADLTDQTAIGVQVVENLQREDLTLTQEIDALTRAIGVGYTIKSVATAISRTQKWVKERLALAELPANVRTLIDNGEINLSEGLALVELIDDPEGIETVLNRKWGDITPAIEQYKRAKTFQSQAAALITKTVKAGHTVIDTTTDNPPNFHPLHQLGINDDDHQGEDCHAFILEGRPPSKPRLTPVCTNKARHAKKGDSTVKTTSPSATTWDEERKQLAREKRDAAAARKDAIATALTSKIPKAEIDNMIYLALIDMAHADTLKAACRVLDIEVPKDSYAQYVLKDWATSKAGSPAKAAAAITLIHQDRTMRNEWPKADARKWLKWLKTHTGYTASKYERNAAKG